MDHSLGLVDAMRAMTPMTVTTASRIYQIITLPFGFGLWFAELPQPFYSGETRAQSDSFP
jgi:hypothetical protein